MALLRCRLGGELEHGSPLAFLIELKVVGVSDERLLYA